MAELGYVEGRDIDLERRYAAGDTKRLPAIGLAISESFFVRADEVIE